MRTACLAAFAALAALAAAETLSAPLSPAPALPPRNTRELRIVVDESVTAASIAPAINHWDRTRTPSTRAAGEPRLVPPPTDAMTLRTVASSPVTLGDEALISTRNGLHEAVRFAYAGHHPLRLRPDDLWLPIILSVTEHVDILAEHFRSDFVAWEGRAELNIVLPGAATLEDIDDAAWPDIIHTITSVIGAHTRSDVVAALKPSFTTSDAVSVAAAGVAIMSAMRQFFSYGMELGCGIREVVLEGKPADWDTLRARTAALAALANGRIGRHLGDWLENLNTTLSSIVDTAHGRPDASFWAKIYSSVPHGSGGQATISGWLLHFFLYDAVGMRVGRRLEADAVPNLFASVDVSVGCRKLAFTSGSWAAGITATGEITPVMEWVVEERRPSPTGIALA